jgi:hypothetical protein
MLAMNDGLMRLILAELLRRWLLVDGEPGRAGRVVKVTGHRERQVDRYPGTSSHWVEDYVDVFWLDDADGSQTYEWRGTRAELAEALTRLVETY